MDSVQPTNWKNYLPSKYIVGLLVVVIAIIGMVAWRSLPHKKAPVPEQVTPVVTATGNPVDRDTDRDGVLDWQEIATGTDPYKPETTEGTPDALAFSNFKNSLDSDKATVFDQIKDTDKVSYTIFNSLQKRTATSETIDDAAFQGVVWDELLNYIKGLTPTEKYTAKDLTVIASSPSADKTYKTSIEKGDRVAILSPQFQADLFAYLANGSRKKQVMLMLDEASKKVSVLKNTPVPEPLVESIVGTLNASSALIQIVSSYNPEETDPLYRYANQVLVRSYEWSLVKYTADFLSYYNDPQATTLRGIISATEQSP